MESSWCCAHPRIPTGGTRVASGYFNINLNYVWALFLEKQNFFSMAELYTLPL